MSSKKAQAISGLKWTAIDQIVRQLVVIGVNIVLARLLEPREFGLIAMIAVFTALGTNMVNSSLTTSLIRSKSISESDYSTVFFANLGISIIVYCILFCIAPAIARFYSQPSLVLITRIFGLSILINAFKAVQIARLSRIMNFKTQAKAQLPTVVVAGATAIICAYFGLGVWSLVIQAILLALLSTGLIWIFSKWRPSLVFNKQKFLNHFNYGYKLTISGILDAIFTNIYPVLIGRIYPASIVGYYKQANTLSQVPFISLSNIINRVSLPMYAKVQNSKEQLKHLNKTIIQMVLLVITPISLFAAITANDLIPFVLTDKWLPAVPYFELLCIVAIIAPISSYNTQLLKAIGRSDLFLKLAIIKKLLIMISISIGFNFGIYGIIIAQLTAATLGLVINLHYTRIFTNYHLKEQLLDFIRPISTITLAVTAVYLMSNYMLLDVAVHYRLIIIYSIGFALYLITQEVVKIDAYKEIKFILFNLNLR